MASTKTCDICGKPAKFVKKLFLAKYGGRNDHSNYTHHADVGECCIERIDQISWQPRISRSKAAAAKAQLQDAGILGGGKTDTAR